MSTVPTDSVLRRHYEQLRLAAGAVPTDSVLRRHHEQMRRAVRPETGPSRAPEPTERVPVPAPEAAEPASTAPEAAVPASAEPPSASRPAATPEPTTSRATSADSAQGGGGFVGWLKRLFGG